MNNLYKEPKSKTKTKKKLSFFVFLLRGGGGEGRGEKQQVNFFLQRIQIYIFLTKNPNRK